MANNAKPVIMVVDDDPAIGEILTRFLGRHKYRVISFTSAKAARDYLKSPIPPNPHQIPPSPFCKGGERGIRKGGIRGDLIRNAGVICGVDLLLTDMNMPEMTGIEPARYAKTLFPTLPIIVMSGSADSTARDEIFALGADFIHKPFELTDLLIRVNSRITQVAPLAPSNGLSLTGSKKRRCFKI